VLRFWNNEVLKNTNAVLQEIWNALHESLSPSPSPSGRGERHPSPLGPSARDEGQLPSPLGRRVGDEGQPRLSE
jgi:hypothetical protein